MRTLFAAAILGLFAFAIASPAVQNSSEETTAATQKTIHKKHKGRSAKGDIGSGAGDIGKGAAKGAGNAAKGAGEAAGDLATLHPIDAAASAGRGGASAGKDVAVGTTKGTAKVVKGIGKGIKHVF